MSPDTLELLQFGLQCFIWAAIMGATFLVIGIPVCFIWAKFVKYMDSENLL